MPRIALSSAEVAAAFEKILSHGEQPTAEKIHALLGKGSVPLIQKHIQVIIDKSRESLTPPPEPAKQDTKVDSRPTTDLFSGTYIDTPPPPAPPQPILQETPSPTSAAIVPSNESNPPLSTAPQQIPSAQQHTGQNKRPFKRERFNNNRNTQHGHNGHHPHHLQQHRSVEIEEAVEIPLEQLPEETLLIKIRRLESILMKEQMRREVSERMMIETKDYAESIKEQVAQRINDLRQSMDIVIEQLKTQLQEQKQCFDQDLRYYQQQLAKANEKIASLLK